VAVLPALSERGVPAVFKPLRGDVSCLPVGWLDGAVGDARGAPVVAALAFGGLGEGGQAGAVDAAQPLLVPGAEVVAGACADDHHAGDVLRGGAVPACP
jgi:hypothetical protein